MVSSFLSVRDYFAKNAATQITEDEDEFDRMLAAFDAWCEAPAADGEPVRLVEELPPPPPTFYPGDAASRYAGGFGRWYRQSAAGMA